MKQPLAYVHPEAQVADNVVIEPFVTIDKNVVLQFWKGLISERIVKYSREQ